MASDDFGSDGSPNPIVRYERRGIIRVGGARMALVDIAGAFFTLRRVLAQDLGFVEKEVIFRAGMEGSLSFLSEASRWIAVTPDANGFRKCIDAYSTGGFGDFQLREFNWHRCRAHIECPDAFEGWACVHNHDLRTEPACDYTRGVFVGMLRGLCQQARRNVPDMVCVETACIGKGDDMCRFVLGPRASLIKEGYSIPSPAPAIREQLWSLQREVYERQLQLHQLYRFDSLVGKSRAMQKVYAAILHAAANETPVFIWGEPGSGRRILATVIHHNSTRREGPLVSLDCSLFAAEALEEAIFGRERRESAPVPGALEKADGGTLVLCTAECMHPGSQDTLCKALQTGRFLRVGGTTPIRAHVRVIAISDRAPDSLVEEGLLMRPLANLLRSICVRVPPLRERVDDVPLLTEHFLHSQGGERRGTRVSREAMERLLSHDWPGNVGELQSVLERAALVSTGGEIGPEHLFLSERRAEVSHYGGGLLAETLEQAEKRVLIEALQGHHWRRGLTAKVLGITRATLYNKMRKYDLLSPTGSHSQASEDV